MIVRMNIDWLSFSIVNTHPKYYYVFENLIEYYNLEKQNYLIRNCEVAYNDYMNVFAERTLNYINIELKPLFFWRYLNELVLDENYYIDYIISIFSNVNYKLSKYSIKFNRVDFAVDYIGDFVSFEKSFNFINYKKIKSLETIRNVGEIKKGLSSYLNGSNWNICRYEKSKEISAEKSYYPDIYRDNNIIRLEIRLKKEYLKNYDKNRQKFFYLLKKLLEDIDDKEINKLGILDILENMQKVKSIKNNLKGEYMILREKILNDILDDLESLHALENIYFNKDIQIDILFNEIKNRYNKFKSSNLKNKERHYRFYLRR